MALRQEEPQKRSYTPPGRDRISPEFRAREDWEKVPDYTKLPDFALIDAAEVTLITGMSPSVLAKRIADGQFPAPRSHGRNRVWPLGEVRRWCERLAQPFAKEGAE